MSCGATTLVAREWLFSNAVLAAATSTTRLSWSTSPTNSLPFSSNVPSLKGVGSSPAAIASAEAQTHAMQSAEARAYPELSERTSVTPHPAHVAHPGSHHRSRACARPAESDDRCCRQDGHPCMDDRRV